MDDVTRHPDDETLHDLVAGALDGARTELVRRHLSRCAACAAFVQASGSAAVALASNAVEPMPVEAAARLHATVATAWRERVAGIAATEAAHDAAVAVPIDATQGRTVAMPTAPLVPAVVADPAAGAGRTTPGAPPRRRARRFVPILAFAVLGALAGASVWVGQQHPRTASDASTAEAPATSGDAADPGGGSFGAERGMAESAGTPSAAEPDAAPSGAASATGTGERGAVTDALAATEPPPPGDDDDVVQQQRMCIATRDPAQLTLPDGRIPQQIAQGPLGTYLVCG